MSEQKKVPAIIVFSLLLAASAMAAIVVERKKVEASCSDLRVAMDGGYSAILRSGGFNPSTELTVYKLKNRKRVKLGTVPVLLSETRQGLPAFVGSNLNLVINKNPQPHTGRRLASLSGEVNGEKVSATLSCEK